MDTSTKAIAGHIAGLRKMSRGMGDHDADAMQALLDDRNDLRQQLHDARDKALEEAAATCAAISKAYWVNWRGTADKYDIGACDGAAECAEDIRALKGAKQ